MERAFLFLYRKEVVSRLCEWCNNNKQHLRKKQTSESEEECLWMLHRACFARRLRERFTSCSHLQAHLDGFWCTGTVKLSKNVKEKVSRRKADEFSRSSARKLEEEKCWSVRFLLENASFYSGKHDGDARHQHRLTFCGHIFCRKSDVGRDSQLSRRIPRASPRTRFSLCCLLLASEIYARVCVCVCMCVCSINISTWYTEKECEIEDWAGHDNDDDDGDVATSHNLEGK